MATKKKAELSDHEIKHLEFIQSAVNRLAANSFQMKGWMLTIVSALLGFFAESGNTKFALVAILPVLVFWGLDAYYLQQERKFRGIYNDVVIPNKTRKVGLFEMPIKNYSDGKYAYWDVFFSQTIMLLYLPVIILLAGIFFVLK